MAETREESTARFAEEDKKYEELAASGAWPSKTCAQCTAGCCQRHHHFTGGLCLHCGMDERRVSARRCGQSLVAGGDKRNGGR